jgi:hypothetical protein
MKPECKIYSDGRQEWYLNGKLHREDGPAIIHPDGTQEWWLNGKLHREDGPAVIDPDGTQYWYLNGKSHREDGPTVIYPDGRQEWYLNDKNITNIVSNWTEERNIDLKNLSEQDKVIFKLEMKMWAK